MSRTEGRKMLAQSRVAGKKYGQEMLGSEGLSDFVAQTMYDKNIPDEDLPRTKHAALRVARNILIDTRYEIERQGNLDYRNVLQMGGCGFLFTNYGEGYVQQTYGISSRDCYDAFMSGFRDTYGSKGAIRWLADEVLFRARERLGLA